MVREVVLKKVIEKKNKVNSSLSLKNSYVFMLFIYNLFYCECRSMVRPQQFYKKLTNIFYC